jgi:hypothetical protein
MATPHERGWGRKTARVAAVLIAVPILIVILLQVLNLLA